MQVEAPIEIGLDVKELLLDISQPRVIPIKAYDWKTSSMKLYVLKVTNRGGVVLV